MWQPDAMRIGLAWKRLRSLPSAYKYMRVSFSQFGEDVLLQNMMPQNRGFYVDVGAYQPARGSNTYKLYLKGWSGVTIEPNPDVASAFKKIRPRDTHVTAGVAKSASVLTYHRFSNPIVNNFNADLQPRDGLTVLERVPVECAPLTDILDEHCRDRRIDLLNVDCESYDLQALESLDWARYRPTVVIVEDFEQFRTGIEGDGAPTPIRSFLAEQQYAFASQAVFSSLFVDRLAFGQPARNEGFRLDSSLLNELAASHRDAVTSAM